MTQGNIEELCATISSMVELAGYATFQPKPGWEWYDMLRKYTPSLAEWHVERAKIGRNWK